MDGQTESTRVDAARPVDEDLTFLDLAVPLAHSWKRLVFVSLTAGLLALGVSYFIQPTYTATTTFLPPQQQQSATANAVLSSLGPLAGLAGGAASLRTPADQYVALMQSVTVSDRIIDQFHLRQVYNQKYRVDARKVLAANTRFTVGKKDGLIAVEVDDLVPQRAAEMANRYVDELRRMTSTIAISEAQQRRMFFEHQLQQTRDKLIEAQQALQASGLTQGALKAEPKSAAEGYARLKAEVTAAEVRLQTMRGALADNAPEVQQQQGALSALRSQLARLEQSTNVQGGPDYVSKYREYKYQETLFDLYARQFELARADESKEGTLIQVVDSATPPERKSKPKRSLVAVAATLLTGLVMATTILFRHAWRRAAQDASTAERMARLREALSRHR